VCADSRRLSQTLADSRRLSQTLADSRRLSQTLASDKTGKVGARVEGRWRMLIIWRDEAGAWHTREGDRL